MASVAFPSVARVDMLTLAQWWPGRVVHEAKQTGDQVIVDRGGPRWRGAATISELNTGAGARAVDAFLAQMSQRENTTELPLGSRASAFAATTASSVSGATVTLAALPTGLAANTYVRSGNRLFLVTSLAVNTRQATLWPSGLLAAGAAIERAATVRVRLNMPEDSVSVGGFVGPWNLKFDEAV